MKNIKKKYWSQLSNSQKLNILGSLLMIFSLFLNWYSDLDMFRSGDTFNALNGPVYLLGYSIMAIAIINLFINLGVLTSKKLRDKINIRFLGKLEIAGGFMAMYLLILANSVFFSHQFGLNILDKKSEFGVLITLTSSILICVGGYLAYRQNNKYEEKTMVESNNSVLQNKEILINQERQHIAIENNVIEETLKTSSEIITPNYEVNNNYSQPTYYSERDTRGKTEYERGKLYENLRKTMMRDTLTPQQRRKEREKEARENAFSANFGQIKDKTVQSANTQENTTKAGAKKTQMYRMDL